MAKYTAVFRDQDADVVDPVLIIHARTLGEAEGKAWKFWIEELKDDSMDEEIIREAFELEIHGAPQEIL